jgi:hypothetical protein
MGRSGYQDYEGGDQYDELRASGWAANVRRCIGGRKGQAFMWELLLALQALPRRELITGGLIDQEGCPCALGAVALSRGKDVPPDLRVTDEGEPDEDYFAEAMGGFFGIKDLLAREVMYHNDEADEWHHPETGAVVTSWPCYDKRQVRTTDMPAERWQRMREWVVSNLRNIP